MRRPFSRRKDIAPETVSDPLIKAVLVRPGSAGATRGASHEAMGSVGAEFRGDARLPNVMDGLKFNWQSLFSGLPDRKYPWLT